MKHFNFPEEETKKLNNMFCCLISSETASDIVVEKLIEEFHVGKWVSVARDLKQMLLLTKGFLLANPGCNWDC